MNHYWKIYTGADTRATFQLPEWGKVSFNIVHHRGDFRFVVDEGFCSRSEIETIVKKYIGTPTTAAIRVFSYQLIAKRGGALVLSKMAGGCKHIISRAMYEDNFAKVAAFESKYCKDLGSIEAKFGAPTLAKCI